MYFRKYRTSALGHTALYTSAMFFAHICVAGAVDITIPNGTTENTTQILTDEGDTLTVEDGGAIDTTGTGTDGANAPEDDQTVNNAGRIDGGDDGVYSSGDRVTIINAATGIITGVDDAIQSDGDDASIVNDGLLEGDFGIFSTGEDAVIENNDAIDVAVDGILSVADRATITNSATGVISGDDDAIQSAGDDASIVNDGLLEGDFGIFSTGEDAGIENNNNIDVAEDGILSEGDRATITNSATGTIMADDDGISSDGDDAMITNDGEIFADDDGINMDGENTTVVNNGLIDVGNDGLDSEDDNQTIINNGTVLAGDRGVESNFTGVMIRNNGLIDVGNDGIRTISDNATVINNGTINADDDGINSDDGDGENEEGEFTRIINNGTINSGDEAIDSEAANHIIINKGTLNADENGIESSESNVFIYNYGSINADEFNGIVVRDDDAYVVNRGWIDAGDDGIDVDDDAFGAVVINSGTVIADVNALLIDGDDATVMLQAGSVLDGGVTFNGLGLILNIGTGLNLYIDYDGEIDTLNSEIPTVHDETNTIIYTVDPTGFALSQSFIQTTSDAVHAAVRSGISHGNGFGGGFAGNQSFAYGNEPPGFAETGPRGWASTFGGYQSQDGSGSVTGGDQAYGGLVAGGGFASDERMYGAFLGGSYSRLETDFDTQEIDASSFYGGLYAGTRSGALWIDGALVFGYSDFNSDRTVANNTVPGGLETATADYDGYFISPSLTLGRSVGERTEISVGGHYAGLFLDGYTETGSAANLTVASRDVHVAAIRAKARYLAHQKQMDSGLFSLETWAGIDGVFNFGDDVAASVVAGPFDAFEATFTDSAAIGFAGVGINHKPTNGKWSFNASLEGRYGTDSFS
ncbi:MAG: autotransporter outer membrane beta-barrel domain-containing protein, partial [Pseudomonadota bacterium]